MVVGILPVFVAASAKFLVKPLEHDVAYENHGGTESTLIFLYEL